MLTQRLPVGFGIVVVLYCIWSFTLFNSHLNYYLVQGPRSYATTMDSQTLMHTTGCMCSPLTHSLTLRLHRIRSITQGKLRHAVLACDWREVWRQQDKGTISNWITFLIMVIGITGAAVYVHILSQKAPARSLWCPFPQVLGEDQSCLNTLKRSNSVSRFLSLERI